MAAVQPPAISPPPATAAHGAHGAHGGGWVGRKMTVAPPSSAAAARQVTYADPATLSVPLEELRGGDVPGVDPKNKELYLTDADFEAAMKMTRAEFGRKRTWRRAKIKRAAGLF